MKERPILFSGPMVRAILAGEKTVTRRVMNPQPEGEGAEWRWPSNKCRSMVDLNEVSCLGPYGGKGDNLWVRETWGFDSGVRHDFKPIGRSDLSGMDLLTHTLYYADGGRDDGRTPPRWRPSIHMPRWASRITLDVTGVTVERLQGITEEQALAEGVSAHPLSETWLCVPRSESAGPYEVFVEPDEEHRKENDLVFVKRQRQRELPAFTARGAFERLWDDINGKRKGCAWNDNPWVWAVSFTRVTP